MYDELVRIFAEWRQGRCSLRLFREGGARINLEDRVGQHVRATRQKPGGSRESAALDLIIEQRYTPLEYAVEKGYSESVAHLLEWLQDHTLLYGLNMDALELTGGPGFVRDRWLLPIVDRLLSRNLVRHSQIAGGLEITEDGSRLLASMRAEAESYIHRYDVFKDVRYDSESEIVELGTGRGEDLRVQVFEAEGLDPVRVVFLLLMYDSALADEAEDWREVIRDRKFFEEMLAPVVDRQSVDDDVLEEIIERGFDYSDELEERHRAVASRREAVGRARTR
jgi:hypothetical protein